MVYDPVKAHDYYERTKHLKERQKNSPKTGNSGGSGGTKPPTNLIKGDATKAAIARVTRLKAKVSTLENALSEARAALSKKRQTAAKEEKKNSDGKTTVKEREAAKDYRDKHEQELKTKRKKAESSAGTSSSSSSNSVSDMGVEDLQSRIIKIQSALTDAKKQLSNASQQLGQLAHSELTSEPTFNDRFARFRSAERIPSK